MILVIGAGAFGTALAVALAGTGPVMLWSRDPDHAEQMRRSRENRRRLPGIRLPETVEPVAGALPAIPAEAVLLAVPMQQLGGFCADQAEALGREGPLVACCKGLELGTGRRPSEVIGQALPGSVTAALTGPSFAVDIARGLPTALTIACADDTVGQALQTRLSTPCLRLYRTTDVIGAELGGALKNVMAIACGAVIGAGLGQSARAALMTRGFAEMTRVALSMGARPETLSGLSGFGDLVLTCTSEQSRNFRFGVSLGRNDRFDPSTTVEGVATARAMDARARKAGLELPVTRAVRLVVDGRLKLREAVDMLLSRPLREE